MRSLHTRKPVLFSLALRRFADTQPASGGGTGNTDPAGNPGASGTTGNPNPAPPGEQDVPRDKDGNRLFTQAELNAARAEEKRQERAKAAADAEAAKAAAAEAAMTEQNQHKELAEQRKARIAQLEPENTRLRELIGGVMEREIAAWPDSVKNTLPPADTDVLTRYEAVERMRDLANELIAAKGTGTGGNAGNGTGGAQGANRSDPPPKAPGGDAAEEAKAREYQGRIARNW